VQRSTIRRWTWGLGISTVTAVTAFGLASWQASAAPADPSPGVGAPPATVSDPDPVPTGATGTGSDPLTTTEVDRARAVALTAALRESARDVTGAKGPEFLSAEITEDDAGRRADVYLYDYRTNKLHKQVVDLRTGKLTGSYAAAGMQRPATDREVSTALDLLLADAQGAKLRSRYAEAAGRAFTGPQDITVSAHTYLPKAADTDARACAKHRCLLLTAEVGDGTYIDINDIIIDLSGRSVVRLG
jgi:hypothetical protein